MFDKKLSHCFAINSLPTLWAIWFLQPASKLAILADCSDVDSKSANNQDFNLTSYHATGAVTKSCITSIFHSLLSFKKSYFCN